MDEQQVAFASIPGKPCICGETRSWVPGTL
jgi:hypothetical protein